MDSLPFTDSQSDYDDYDEFDFDEDDAFGYYEALLSSDESLAEVPDSQLPSLPPLKFEIKELLESFLSFFHCSSSPFLRVSVANTSVVADLRGISCPKVA